MAGRGQPRQIIATTPEELESKVRERCLNLLAQQPRTRAELERSLARAGAPEDVVGQVLDRFATVGLVDDAAYAEAYVRTGIGVRRRGTRSLSAELRVRGVDPGVIESATSEVDAEAERETALALAQRRVASMSRLALVARRRRLMGLLLRRGFSTSIVSSVLEEVLSSSSGGEESSGLSLVEGSADSTQVAQAFFGD